MKKRTIVILSCFLLFLVASLFVLRHYKMDLVFTAVEDAVMEKAPAGFSRERIRQAFDSSRRDAASSGNSDTYLRTLLKIAHRIEKVQRLQATDVEAILQELKAGSSLQAAPSHNSWNLPSESISEVPGRGRRADLKPPKAAPPEGIPSAA